MGFERFQHVPNDTSGEMVQKQIALLRQAGPQKRLGLALSLSQSVKVMALRAITQRNPQMNSQEIRLKWAEIHYGTEMANRVRRNLENRTAS